MLDPEGRGPSQPRAAPIGVLGRNQAWPWAVLESMCSSNSDRTMLTGRPICMTWVLRLWKLACPMDEMPSGDLDKKEVSIRRPLRDTGGQDRARCRPGNIRAGSWEPPWRNAWRSPGPCHPDHVTPPHPGTPWSHLHPGGRQGGQKCQWSQLVLEGPHAQLSSGTQET